MGKHINDTFLVEVGLESNMDYVPIFNVEASFELSEEGPVKLRIESMFEILSDEHIYPLVISKYEFARIRAAVADAIERKYYAGILVA